MVSQFANAPEAPPEPAEFVGRLRRLAADLEASGAAGRLPDADYAAGLAAVLRHAARSLDSAVGDEVDLDAV